MSTPDEKNRHSKRLRRKKQERVRSVIAKELIVSGKYNQKIVPGKNGTKYDLNKLSFRDLVEAIQEDEDNNNDS